MELLTAEQMRALERAAIDDGDVTGLELMERAGRGFVEALFKRWPKVKPTTDTEADDGVSDPQPHVVVLCGPGNNGGDGFVIARLLFDLGWQVELLFWGDADRLPPDARANYDAWCKRGAVSPLTVAAAKTGPRPMFLVDALLGIGANRALPRDIALAHRAIEERDVGDTHPWLKAFSVIAVDCPSGMDSDSGKFLMPEPPVPAEGSEEDDAAIDAWWQWWSKDACKRLLRTDLAVTFHRLKPAHVLNKPLFETELVDIGLGTWDDHPAHLLMPRASDMAHLVHADFGKKYRRAKAWPGHHLSKQQGHKFNHGNVVVFTGGAGKTGAARLAARSALRIGAGLVTLGVPGSAQMEVASQITALMLTRVDSAEQVAACLSDARINAVCMGPGLGLRRARDWVPCVLRTQKPCVLDADALSAFQDRPEDLFADLHAMCVLTPHEGEFKRLFPDLAARLTAPAVTGPAFSKLDATRAAAARAGCSVLFKGVDTVIADPDGNCAVHAALHDRAAPWLATAGAGDVLAGMITGLMARDVAPMPACEVAAWLHVEAARAFGPGLIAEDLPEVLPKVLARVLSG